jgi:DNA repair exonuclease SbcCD ATPase subunit
VKLARILIVDFMSHARTELFFEDGVTCFYGRNLDKSAPDASNGSGKSAILYAVVWALHGQLPQSCDKNDVIRRDTSGCHVELDLEGRDGSLKIVRSKLAKSGEKVSATWNNQTLGVEAAVVQPKLEAIYGVSWTTFCNTVFLGPQSEAAQFVQTTPAKRATILAELINDKAFQDAGDRVGAEMSLLKREQDAALAAASQIELNVQSVTATMQRLSQSYADEQEVQRSKEAQSAQQTNLLEIAILQAQEKLKHPPEITPTEVQARLNTLEENRQRVQAKIAGLTFRIQQQSPRVGDACGTCGQPFSTHAASELAQIKHNLEYEREVEQRSLRDLASAAENLRAQMMQVQGWAQQRVALESQVNTAKQQIYLLKQQLENRTLVVLHHERETAQANLKQLRDMLEEKQAVIGSTNLRMPILKVLYAGFKQEIRNMLLDDVRSVLQFHSSQFVEALAGDEFTVEFPPTTSTGREKFEIEIKSQGKRNRLTSGGESYRAQLAILLSLALAMKHQQKSPFQFLMIDEALSFVDPEGARAFANLMRALTPHFPQILVTAPTELEEMPGQILWVERRNRCSTVTKR